jgi:dTDP-glucose 4,6-dehydratase
MTVLVTGADGFLGSVLMSRNPDFLGVDLTNKNPNVSICDVRDTYSLQEYIVDNDVTQIVHLAGVQFGSYIRRRSRSKFFNQNVELAETIRNVALSANVQKIVYVSTDMVYGDKVKSPLSEHFFPEPIGEYGSSKLEAENILSSGMASYEIVILRPRLILGKGRVGTIQKLSRLIKSPLPIILIGNGKNKYQFVAVDDVCNAIELSLKPDITGIFNIGSDNPPSLDILFHDVLFNLNRKKMILKVPMKIAIFIFDFLDWIGFSPLTPEQYKIAGLDFVLNTDKIKRQLGWVPTKDDQTILLEALSDLIFSQ